MKTLEGISNSERFNDNGRFQVKAAVSSKQSVEGYPFINFDLVTYLAPYRVYLSGFTTDFQEVAQA